MAHKTALTEGSDLQSARPQQPHLDALVLDVGGVLVGHDNTLMIERLAARCRSRDAVERLSSIVFEPRWGIGRETTGDLHALLQRDLGYAGDWDTFLQDWTCHFALDEAMTARARALAAKCRVILFSNTNQEHWDFLLARYPGGLDPFERYLSHEIGLAKPNVAAFEHVANAAAIEPNRSLFFDDRHENVVAARQTGFAAHVFRDLPTFEEDLRRFAMQATR